MSQRILFGLWLAFAAFALVACSGPVPGESNITPPPRQDFSYVSEALGRSCGTLDCHGQGGRNMRVWNQYGMRASARDVPGGVPTTQTEYDWTYRSVVGLEPEVMSQVVEEGGKDPERLTMIRKARGTEKHKGKKLMNVGDALDVCITSWLASKVSVAACKQAAPAFP